MDLTEFDIDFLSQRLSDNPQSPLFARLADLYLSKNQSSEALKLCESGVQAYSSYATGYVVLGKCYRSLSENSKAKLAFTQALHLSPFNQVARKLLSETLQAIEEAVSATTAGEAAPVTPLNAEIAPVSEAETGVVESIPVAAAVESELAAQEVEITPPAVEVLQEPGQPDVAPPVELPAEAEIPPPPVMPEVPPEPLPLPEAQAASMVSFPGIDEYIQLHSASLAQKPMIPLSEYLGLISSSAVPAPPATTDLESLVSRLENADRIVPQESAPEPSSSENVPSDAMVITPTLAEIYASQGEYGAAIQVYEILILSKPDERDRYEKRIKELQAKLYDGG